MREIKSHYYKDAAERFNATTRGFVMTVIQDHGTYRHLQFKHPENGIYRFELITWPGHLAITGDVAPYAFARSEDMFEFFEAGVDINPGYWAEKLIAENPRSPHKGWSTEKFRELVTEAVAEQIEDLDPDEQGEVWEAVNDELLEEGDFEDTARLALDTWRHDVVSFDDVWEWDMRDWTWSYLWSLCAIRAGISEYRRQQLAPVAAAA